jgi:hypothetical protein
MHVRNQQGAMKGYNREYIGHHLRLLTINTEIMAYSTNVNAATPA